MTKTFNFDTSLNAANIHNKEVTLRFVASVTMDAEWTIFDLTPYDINIHNLYIDKVKKSVRDVEYLLDCDIYAAIYDAICEGDIEPLDLDSTNDDSLF